MTRLLIWSLAAITLVQSAYRASAGEQPKPADNQAAPARSTQELILDAILRDVLGNPSLKNAREFYGIPGDKQIALVTNPHHGIPWPKKYQPRLGDITVHWVREGAQDEKRDEKPRMLGVRIDKMNLKQKKARLFDAPIEITILNGGGDKDRVIMGGRSVYYVPKRKGDHWTVEYSGSFDP